MERQGAQEAVGSPGSRVAEEDRQRAQDRQPGRYRDGILFVLVEPVCWTVSGTAEVTSLAEAHVLDVTGDPMWLNGAQSAFRAEADRSYLVVAPEAVLRPEVRPLVQNTLKSNDNQADYLLISPRAMLDVAQPLLDWRSEQGLTVMALPVEEVYQEFGFGEERPEAVRDFLA